MESPSTERIDWVERKRSLSPLKDSPRSITSAPKSPAHSIFSKETKETDETSPVSATVRHEFRDGIDYRLGGRTANKHPREERTRKELIETR
jgi:hypothetical protein